jgi:hypothetical protein
MHHHGARPRETRSSKPTDTTSHHFGSLRIRTFIFLEEENRMGVWCVVSMSVCLNNPELFSSTRTLDTRRKLHGRDVDERIATIATLWIEHVAWYLFYDRYNEIFKNSIIEQGLRYSIINSLQYSTLGMARARIMM